MKMVEKDFCDIKIKEDLENKRIDIEIECIEEDIPEIVDIIKTIPHSMIVIKDAD